MGVPNQTGVVPYGNRLERNKWVLQALVQEATTSWWSGLKGSTSDAVVFISTDASKKDGHEVIFQFNGNVTGEAKIGKERVRGTEEEKKIFSDKIRVKRIRKGVSNGDKFDAINIGDSSLSEHSDSMSLLADWYIRMSDQGLFDASQGANGEGLTHIVRPNDKETIADLTIDDTMSYAFLLQLEKVIKTSRGFTQSSGKRTLLKPYKLASGQKKYILMIDATQAQQLAQDEEFQRVVSQADVRGADNILLSGVIGEFRSFIIMEVPEFMGTSSSTELGKSAIEISGLRQIDDTGAFSGHAGFGVAGTVVASRAVVLGRTALQQAFGLQPRYAVEDSDDYGITSSSIIEVWTNIQATIYSAENGDYDEAKIAGYQFGIVGADTYAYLGQN